MCAGREYKLVDDIDQDRYGCDGGTQEEQIIVRYKND